MSPVIRYSGNSRTGIYTDDNQPLHSKDILASVSFGKSQILLQTDKYRFTMMFLVCASNTHKIFSTSLWMCWPFPLPSIASSSFPSRCRPLKIREQNRDQFSFSCTIQILIELSHPVSILHRVPRTSPATQFSHIRVDFITLTFLKLFLTPPRCASLFQMD